MWCLKSLKCDGLEYSAGDLFISLFIFFFLVVLLVFTQLITQKKSSLQPVCHNPRP